MFQLRLNFATPYPYHANTDVAISKYNPQAFFVDQDWGSITVPPLFQRYLDAIGYLIVDGNLVVPFVTPVDDLQKGGTAITTGQTVPIGVLRYGAYSGVESVVGRILDRAYLTVPAAQVAPALRIQNTVYNYAYVSGFYNSTDATNATARRCNNFVNGNKGTISTQWKSLLTAHCSGQTFNDSFIQSKNQLHGRCSAMLMQVVVGRNAPKWEIFPANSLVTDATYQYTFNCFEAAVVGGLVALPNVCLVDAITQCASFVTTDDTRTNQGKYSFQVKSGASTDSFITTINQRTFAPNSSVAQAFQASRAAAAKRQTIEVGKTRLPKNAKVFDWAGPAMERIMTTVADTLQVASRLAHFPLQVVAGPMLANAATAAMTLSANKLKSWALIGSGDPYHPDTKYVNQMLSAVVSRAQQKKVTSGGAGPRAALGPAVNN
jgi:hypothetical protein